MKKLCFLFVLALTVQAHAYDGMTSEIPHAIGGALLAGAITKSFEEHEQRVLIGFSVINNANHHLYIQWPEKYTCKDN